MTGEHPAESATIVVPCHNEAERLDAEACLRLVRNDPDVSLLLVNDGSTDRTQQRLDEMAAELPSQVQAMTLTTNVGKAEAVRSGLLRALDQGVAIVGYLDADLATPPEEALRLLDLIRSRGVQVVLGARVALLGRIIDRSAVRHYLGRIFASAASLALRLRVYDTQCGAKFFRAGPALSAALNEPFLSRWAFDVELLGRLLAGAEGVAAITADQILEEPLVRWRDVPGSKLRASGGIGAGLDLARIARDLRRRSHRR